MRKYYFKVAIALVILLPLVILKNTCFAQEAGFKSNLYNQSVFKITDISKDLNQLILDCLLIEFKYNADIEKTVNENKEAISLFKRAVLEESDGFIFGEMPRNFSSLTKITDYSKLGLVFKLLLLEAKFFENKMLFEEAAKDYLAATRFILHLSQQRYDCLTAFIIRNISFNLSYKFLEETTKNPKFSLDYLRSLIKNMGDIKINQDFMEHVFDEEALKVKKIARSLEEFAHQGANFGDLFGIGENKHNYPKEIDSMLDDDFFMQFYAQVDNRIVEFAQAATLAVKNNDYAIYKDKIGELGDSLGLSEEFQKTSNEESYKKSIVVRQAARIFLISGIPFSDKFIEQYYDFDGKINNLINMASIEYYNKSLS